MPEPKPEHDEERPPVPPKNGPHDFPPFIIKELMKLEAKVGKLEGIVEVLLKQQGK